MKSIPVKKIFLWIFFALAAAALIGLSVWNSQKGVHLSQDELGKGITERWNGGLPEGYAATEARDLDENGFGYLFAKLVYEKDIAKLLEQWESAADGAGAQFEGILEEYLSSSLITDGNRSTVAAGRPEIGQEWTGFAMDKDDTGARIVLLYDPQTTTMYVAEKLV